MSVLPDAFSPSLAFALMAYALGVASPGPSTLAIMGAAMSGGRRAALWLACGIWMGSLTWGLLAAMGLAAVMTRYAWLMVALKVLGGAYMLHLAWRVARSALSPMDVSVVGQDASQPPWRLLARGLGMHLTNPKAVFVWLSMVALGLPPGAAKAQAFWVVACCGTIAAAVFLGYALVFSLPGVRQFYGRIRRTFNLVMASAFALAGFRLLWTRSS